MTIDLTDPIFNDDDAAREHLEAIRWPDGPFCPHCGEAENVSRLKGKSHRPGLFQCNSCREHFTVTVGSVMERSHVPLAKWVLAFHLMAASKKGISAHQLHRMLGVQYKTAWFMAHRIREAMTETDPAPLGGKGKVIEADETYIGPSRSVFHNDKGWQLEQGISSKRKIVALVERGGRSRMLKVEKLTAKNVREFIVTNASRDSTLYTDEARYYPRVGKEFAKHESVNHSLKEYARGDVTTNTVEGFFSIFKRGMRGVYQHCGDKHLQRYLDEFNFRYSNRVALGVDDALRTDRAIKGAEGKRLTYRRTRLQQRGNVVRFPSPHL